MKPTLLASIAAVVLVVATVVVYDRSHRRVLVSGDRPVSELGDRPVSELQVREKLQADGYTNIQLMFRAGYFEITVSKDGKPAALAIDAATGRLANEPFHAADEEREGDLTK